MNGELFLISLPGLAHGALVSLQITGVAWLIGFTLGIIISAASFINYRPILWLINAYTLIIRGTPMLIQITFIYYVLPMIGLKIPTFWAAALAIGINSGAYLSQTIRGGIAAVGTAQIEAARALGFSSIQSMWYIVLPQALRITLPSLANEAVTLMKDSSLASTIGVMELYKESQIILHQTWDVITIFTAVALFYIIATSVLTIIAHYIERHMNWYTKKTMV